MKIALKITVILFGLLLITVLAGGVWLANLDPNNYKSWIQAQVLEATGARLHLDGNIELELYPWLSVAADDVRVANPPGFGNAPLATVEHVAFRARLLPLLSRNFEIDTVTLRGLDAHLITTADGATNWADNTVATGAEPSTASSGLTFNDLRVGGVSIERVNVSLEDQRAGTRTTISDLNFNSDDLVYGQPINLSLAFAIAADSPALDADVSLTGTVNYDLDNERYDIAPLQVQAQLRGSHLPNGHAEVSIATALHFDLRADRFHTDSLLIEAPQTRLDASLDITDLQRSNPRVDSQLQIESQDLALLLRIAGIEPLATQIAQLPARGLSLRSQLVAYPANGDMALPEFALQLLGASITGSLAAESLNSNAPLLRGNVRASGPNLPTVMEVLGQLSGGRDSKLAEGGRLMQDIPEKRFDLTADFDADLARGTVQVPVFNASLLGTELTATLSANALNSNTPNARGQLQASGADLPLLMQIGSWFALGADSAPFRYGSLLGSMQDRSYALASEFDVDLRSGAINISQLDARAFGQQLDGRFTAANIRSGSGAVNGSLNLTGSNLPALLRAIEQPDLAEVAQSMALELQFGGTSNNLSIDPARAQVTLSGPRIANSPVTVALDAASRINVERESVQIDSFALQGLGLNVRGRISGSDLFSNPDVAGAVEIAEFNPRRLLTQLNQAIPDTSDPTVFQAMALNAGFEFSATDIALTELALRLDDTNVNGSFSARQAETTQWQLDLDIDTLNIDRYLAEGEPADNTATDNTAMPIPVETLRSFDGSGRLDIGNLQVAGLSLSDLSATLAADNGLINLAPLSSNLYQGSFNGSINLDATQALPTLGVNVALQQVAIESLLLDMLDAAMVSGNGSVQLDVRSAGADTLALRQGLTGTGRINLENGILRGVDVGSVLAQLETMLRSRSATQFDRGQQTAFDSFAATLQFDNGVINSNDLLIKSPGFQVTGRGTLLNLHNDRIDFNLLTAVDAATATRNDQQYDVGGYNVPIACSGTITAPRCLPDASEIMRTVLANEVRDQVGDLLRRATGTTQPEANAADQDNADQQQADPATQLINRALERLRPN